MLTGTQEFPRNECVDEVVSVFEEDNARSPSVRNERNSVFNCDVDSGDFLSL